MTEQDEKRGFIEISTIAFFVLVIAIGTLFFGEDAVDYIYSDSIDSTEIRVDSIKPDSTSYE